MTEIIAFNPGFRFKAGLPVLALDIDAIKEKRQALIDSGTTFVCPRHVKSFPVGTIKNQRLT
jgi:hypothetical protein